MSGLRFKVGDLAILAFATDPSGIGSEGEVVEIYSAGPYQPGDRVPIRGVARRIGKACDYVIRFSGTNDGGICHDYQLRKIDPPAEPESLTRENECEVTA